MISALCLGMTACGSDGKGPAGDPPEKPEPYLGLTTPVHGFQIRSLGTDIAPGEEREYCEVAQIPGAPVDEYYVSSMELANASRRITSGWRFAPGTQPLAS